MPATRSPVYTPSRRDRPVAVTRAALPVHAGMARGLDVRTVVNFKASDRQDFVELELDAAVVAAYGLILPPEVLAAPGWVA